MQFTVTVELTDLTRTAHPLARTLAPFSAALLNI